MKFFGHANLQQNELQRAVIPLNTNFPTTPVVGELAFTNSILYICVSVADDLPVWVPLTREITLYTHNQSTSSAKWTITHDLNTTSVLVNVYDAANKMVIPSDISVDSPSQITVSLNTEMTGRAVVLSGHFDGNVKPTYAFTYYQTDSSTTWTIVHGLGYQPIVRVFIGNQEVQPLSIVHDSVNQVTITFTTPQVGVVRLI
jgi:hypothetical protein